MKKKKEVQPKKGLNLTSLQYKDHDIALQFGILSKVDLSLRVDFA